MLDFVKIKDNQWQRRPIMIPSMPYSFYIVMLSLEIDISITKIGIVILGLFFTTAMWTNLVTFVHLGARSSVNAQRSNTYVNALLPHQY
jgi:hypothetical protein